MGSVSNLSIMQQAPRHQSYSVCVCVCVWVCVCVCVGVCVQAQSAGVAIGRVQHICAMTHPEQSSLDI